MAQEPQPVSFVTDTTLERTAHPSRVLVRFRNRAQREFLPGSTSARAFAGDPALSLVENPPGLSVAEAVRRYQESPNVEYAEPDYVVHADTTPTDPRWREQWDMVRIAAPTAWTSQTDSSGVVVAVIDSGIDFTHPDLQANLWVNSDGSHGFTCTNGQCVPGGFDDNGHGTHVAGTIGAVANNGTGIAGINWSVQLLSAKFIGSNGTGYISDAVLALDRITSLKVQGVNIRVTNNSWGGGGFSQAVRDAMLRAEAADILHVCAAGNSNQNADGSPMYPAAYDNRGIVSVLATDKNDAGGSFSNYGLAAVDIAAPGVATLSTVPSGSCKLCDRTGYRLLSGTSMASPHVAGVLAAIFQRNPGLTAIEARDVLLDRASYDPVSDSKARTSSTGGRLNFARVLANPLLFFPVLNGYPTLSITSDAIVTAGAQIELTASPFDPDNDPVRMSWVKSESTASQWLLGWMLNSLFPEPAGSSVMLTAPAVARTATVAYDASVADGRGGSSQGRAYATVLPTASPGGTPSGVLNVSPLAGPPGTTVTVNFAVSDPEGERTGWDMIVGSKYIANRTCCFTGSSTNIKFSNAGVYRISTQAVDTELNLSARSSTVVRIGGAAGEPPIARATLDKLSGPAPLTVNIDMSASVDPDGGKLATYYFECGDGMLTRSRRPQGSCSFGKPGTYWIMLLAQDASGYVDQISAYVVAMPKTP